ncbi:hypothetical protein CBW46_009300 [Paenibacillus xerothermodurans]|uniref:Uncharacterized protein n=1 Tax=Paenibacillus xerothermodurans TaxID=1977292 RepID=A0A2W1NN23_PAEXE|nr:hypothetical protein CBW46_009300 [Paenibacillus xerothermodurans]
MPDHEAEQANIHAIRTGGKATISTKTAARERPHLPVHIKDNMLEQATATVPPKVNNRSFEL